MTYKEFKNKIIELELVIKNFGDNTWGIGYPQIANPMLYFKHDTSPEDYFGSISVKAINISLFTADEIKASLKLVNDLLMTPINERGEI